jgi:5-aminopentanamidase
MRIACWQAELPSMAGDLDRLAATAERAAAAGAALLVTPELFATGYPPSRSPLAPDYPRRVERIAADSGIAIVHGWPEAAGAGVRNAAGLVTPAGGTVATYHKTHLYGEHERAAFTPGDDLVVQGEVDGLTVGLAICYDVEFPELVRAHALAGTHLLAVPTALARPWDFVAETLVPTRAFESQLHIAYTNWTGLEYAGRTRVADPHGHCRTAPPDGEHLLLAEVDPAELATARETTPYLTDLRPDLYPRWPYRKGSPWKP